MVRPNRMNAFSKDLKYYDDWSTYINESGRSSNSATRVNHARSRVNWAFLKNRQWIFDDDVTRFLMDKGVVKNRLKITYNIILPMVRRIVGNAIRNSFSYNVESISRRATNRRERELNDALAITKIANATSFGDALRQSNPLIGEDEQQTTEKFYDSYVDKYASMIEVLMRNVAERNDFEEMKSILARNLVVDGVATVFEDDVNGEQVFEPIRSHEYFPDPAARKWDGSDSEWQFHVAYESPSYIAEKYSAYSLIKQDDLALIEKIVSDHEHATANNHVATSASPITPINGRVPVVKAFWRDGEWVDYGVVVDDYGIEIYTKINHPDSKYTDKDLVESERYQSLLDGKLKKRVWEDYINFSYFIPNGVFSGAKKRAADGTANIILRYGKREYQDKDSFVRSESQFPYKRYPFLYDEGEFISPLDIVVDPQRYINRLLSIAEHHVHAAHPSGTAIDKHGLAGASEEEIHENIANGQIVTLDSGGIGINQMIGRYGGSFGESTGLYNLVQGLTAMMGNITGDNESIAGTGTAHRANGVAVQNQVFQGLLMQEDLFYALGKVFESMYSSIARRGKKIYIDNKTELIKIVGESHYEHFVLTEDLYLEDFRSFVTRGPSRAEQVQEGNQLLMTFLSMQLISRKTFAQMFNKSTARDVERALVEYQKAEEEARGQIAEQQALVQEAQIARAEFEDARDLTEADAIVQAEQSRNTTRLIDSATKLASQGIPK